MSTGASRAQSPVAPRFDRSFHQMKTYPATIGILLIAAIALFVYEYTKTAQVRSELKAIARDREELNTKLRNLDRGEPSSRPAAVALAAARPSEVEHAVSASAPTWVKPTATPGVSVSAPAGWTKNGSNTGAYVVGVDEQHPWGGKPSAYVTSNGAAPDEVGGMTQKISAENFIGQRVRLNGWIKTDGANDGGGHLWFRVDGQQVGAPLQFDNMGNRSIKGTSDWQECSVVLDVPPDASALAYGFFIKGGGRMWVNGIRMEAVGRDVPSTNVVAPALMPENDLPKLPVNLGFVLDPPK